MEMLNRLECLLWNHEDLSSNPQNPLKYLGMADSSDRKWKQSDCEWLMAASLGTDSVMSCL